jgi:hypothetical protein
VAKAKHPVREAGGRQCHVNAFEAIAVNGRRGTQQSTLRWLEEHGLIEGSYRTIGRDQFGEIRVVDWSVPMWAHAQWCDWAAENVTEDV